MFCRLNARRLLRLQILLDNFIAATTSEKQRRAIEKQRKTRVVGHALDPLLEMLAATYDTTYDLSKRIEQIYTVSWSAVKMSGAAVTCLPLPSLTRPRVCGSHSRSWTPTTLAR